MGTERSRALDCTKGIAIFAVVLFHVTRGLANAGQLEMTALLRFADTFAYGFHVQTFFLIAGFLAYPRAAEPLHQIQRQAYLYHAYILWSLVSWLLVHAFASTVNKVLDWQDLLWMPLVPFQHFWFILVLMAGTAMIAVARSPAALLGGALLSSLLASDDIHRAFSLHGIGPLAMFTSSMPFILIGAWLRACSIMPPVSLPLALAGLIALGLTSAAANAKMLEMTSATALPAMLGGCYAAYVAGAFASRTIWPGRLLGMLGRNSFVIYLLHVIGGAGTRIILFRLAPELPVGLTLILVLGASLGLPIVAAELARRWRIDGILGFVPIRTRRPEMNVVAA